MKKSTLSKDEIKEIEYVKKYSPFRKGLEKAWNIVLKNIEKDYPSKKLKK